MKHPRPLVTALAATALAGLPALSAPAAGAAGAAGAAAGAAPPVAALWQFDEAAGRTRAWDSGPLGIHGVVNVNRTGTATTAPRVLLARSSGVGTGKAYQFPAPPAGPDNNQLVIAPGLGQDHQRLDPRGGAFAVQLRFRTGAQHPNLVQKGQGGTAGGFWKVEVSTPAGSSRARVLCYFEQSATARVGAYSDAAQVDVADGAWHTVRCARSAPSGGRSTVTVTVDGWHAVSASGALGAVDNGRPLVVGGKSECGPAWGGTDCDYFSGLVDYVRVESTP